MTVGNNFSFNNKIFEVNSQNKQNSVSERFSTALKKASIDGNIDEKEQKELEEIANQGGTESEKEIVMTLSKGGKAILDPDAEGQIKPVEITFGTPKPKVSNNTSSSQETNQTGKTNTNTNNTENKEVKTVTFQSNDGIPISYKISNQMASTFHNLTSGSNPKISYDDFNNLMEMAKKSGNPDDIKFVQQLASMAKTTLESKKDRLDIQLEGDSPIKLRVDTTPPKTKPAGFKFGNFLDGLINTAKTALEAKAQEYQRTHGGYPNQPTQPYQPTFFNKPIKPTGNGFHITFNSGLDTRNRVSVGGGFSYGTSLGGKFRFGVEGTYNVPLFRAPGGFIGETFFGTGDPTNRRTSGFSATGTIYFGNSVALSYNTGQGFSLRANMFNTGKDSKFYFNANLGNGSGQRTGFGIGFSKKL